MHVSVGLIAIIMFSQSRKKYGANNKADVPGGTINYIYQPNTGNTNLWKHLYKVHAAKYNQKVKDNHNWNYLLSTQVKTRPSTRMPAMYVTCCSHCSLRRCS